MRIRLYCKTCFTKIEPPMTGPAEGNCPRCATPWRSAPTDSERSVGLVDRCAGCGGRAFFVQRDFDQRIGCAIMAASIGLALAIGWKFGWIWFTPVLLSTVLIDWVLAIRIGPVTICYRCDAEYRDVHPNPRHRPYDPHVAERYAEARTVRRMLS